MMKKATNLVYNAFSKCFFALANLKDINGYNMMKKFSCHYITLGLIFSYLLNLTHHFWIYLQLQENFEWIFLGKTSLGIVHYYAEICRKLLILCTESSKIWHKIVTFSAPNILDPLPTLALRPKSPELKRFGNN